MAFYESKSREKIFLGLEGWRTKLDLENPSRIDTYVQKILLHGKADDIKKT